MSQTSSASLRSSSPQVFSEIDDNFVEATEADLEEYARRIGIDPVHEQHLLYLANEGLMQKLPGNWKPCREPHRKAWYYYNIETTKSQWEHPMDAVYRQKVSQARTDHAMNRIQTFDMSTTKTLKNLPPLRMSGGVGGLKPLVPLFLPTSTNSSETNNSLFNQPLGTLKNKLQPLTIPTQLIKSSGLVVTGGGAKFLKSSSQKSENYNEDLYEATTESNDISQGGLLKQKMINTSTIPSSGSPTHSSLKGILANSMSRSIFEERTSTLTNWDPNPSFMTAQEKNLWKTLEDSGSITKRTKGNVKFNLDEDPEIHFENSSISEKIFNQKQDETDETEGSTSHSNTEEDEDISEEISRSLSQTRDKIKGREGKLLGLGPRNSAVSINESSNNHKTPAKDSISLPEPKITENSKNIVSQIGAGEKPSEVDLENLNRLREKMHADMENELKTYQEVLEVERKQRESQMKKHMEQVLEESKRQNEETIKKFKATLEKQGQTELEKARRDMDASLNQIINKLRDENQEKILKEKENLLKEHKKMLQDMDTEINKLNLENELKEKRKEGMAIIEAELQEELKILKETMREDQKRQTQQMRDYHASYLYKLKGEFKAEEDAVRSQQTLLLSEIIETQKKENDELIKSLKSNHEIELNELRADYEIKKHAMEMRLNDSYTDMYSQQPVTKIENFNNSPIISETTKSHHQPPPTIPTTRRRSYDHSLTTIIPQQKTSELEMKESELLRVRAQYEQLQEKHKMLKQSLRNVVTTERNKNKTTGTTNKQQQQQQQVNETGMFINASYIDLNTTTGNGDDITTSSQSEVDDGAGTSLDVSGSDLKKFNRQNNNNHNNNNKDNHHSSSRIEQIKADSEERVNKALSALEILREQIMEIKSEQDQTITTMVVQSSNDRHLNDDDGNIKKRNINKYNVYPTNRRNSDIIHQPTTTTSSKMYTSSNSNNARMQMSKSATDIKSLKKKSMGENIDDIDMSEAENRHLVVEEAKDFIKSQKRRLSKNIPGYGLKSINSSTNIIAPSPGFIKQQHLLQQGNRKDYLYSETESSGLGSLKSLPINKDRIQVSKDIDCILLSLKKLDKQMKYLWSVVGNPNPNGNNSNNNMTMLNSQSSSRSPNHFHMITTSPAAPALLTPLIHPVSPPALAQLTRLVENNNIEYPLSNKSTTPFSTTNELTSRYSLGPHFFTEANSNLMSNLKKISHTNFNLDEHVNNLRNTQARISHLPPDDDMSTSLMEKTKDLREWLDKF